MLASLCHCPAACANCLLLPGLLTMPPATTWLACPQLRELVRAREAAYEQKERAQGGILQVAQLPRLLCLLRCGACFAAASS